MTGPSPDHDADQRFPSFLQYDPPTIAPGIVSKSVAAGRTAPAITLLDDEAVPPHLSIPAAKLAEAKRAARETYLASQTFAAGKPVRGLPTPPIAGRRLVPGTNRSGGPAKKGDGRGHAGSAPTAARTIAAPPPQLQQQQQEVLSSLMRSAKTPRSFTAHVLAMLFPPRLRVVETGDGSTAPTGACKDGHALDAPPWVGRAEVVQGSSSTAAPSPPPPGPDSEAAPGEVRPVSVQSISAAPATREQVARLHDALRARLVERRAKPTDLCPIRRAIYDDVFAEVLRQVTVEEPARGVLLQRIRAESEHALTVHADLLARAHNLAARQERVGERLGLDALHARVEALQREKAALEARRHELLLERNARELKVDADRVARQTVEQEELAYLRRANQQLSIRLKAETERASSHADATAASGANGSGAESTV